MPNKMIAKQSPEVIIFILSNVFLWSTKIPWLEYTIQVNLLLSLITGLVAGLRLQRISPRSFFFVSLFSIYGLLAYFVGPCTDSAPKVIISSLVIFTLLISLKWLADSIRWDSPLITKRTALVVLFCITFAALFEFSIKLTEVDANELRVGGLYSEPSHLALTACPFLYYLWHTDEKIKSIIFTFILSMLAYSTTLFIILSPLIIIPYTAKIFRKSGSLISAAIISLLFSAIYLLDTNIESSSTFLRITDLVNLREESNLSSLVYANGWQQLISYNRNTLGMGLGINAMGCNPLADTQITEWLALINLENQNSADGSFIFSKIASEFGIFGITIMIFLFFFSLKKLLKINSTNHPSIIITIGWLCVLTVGGFIRSANYFSGPLLLAIFSFYVIQSYRNKINLT